MSEPLDIRIERSKLVANLLYWILVIACTVGCLRLGSQLASGALDAIFEPLRSTSTSAEIAKGTVAAILVVSVIVVADFMALKYLYGLMGRLRKIHYRFSLHAWVVKLRIADGREMELFYDVASPVQIQKKDELLAALENPEGCLILGDPDGESTHLPKRAVVEWTVFECGAWTRLLKPQRLAQANNIIVFPR